MTWGPKVVVVHTEDGPREIVRTVAIDQWPEVEFILTPRLDPFAYGTILRRLWSHRGDLVVIEEDVCPPEGGVKELLACDRRWCTFPHFTGERYTTDTFGCIKLSWELRISFPMLIHTLYAAEDPRYFVRRGWTLMSYDVPPAVLNNAGRRATLLPNFPAALWPADFRQRPTTHDWLGLDTTLLGRLKRLKYEPHVHEQPTLHLHDYKANPVEARLPWHQRPYDPREWRLR